MQAICPECEAKIPLPKDVMRGEILNCLDCGIEVELVDLDTLKCEIAQPDLEDYGE